MPQTKTEMPLQKWHEARAAAFIAFANADSSLFFLGCLLLMPILIF